MKLRFITFFAALSLAVTSFARQPQRGYRGFVDWNNSIRSCDVWYPGNKATCFYSGLSTVHGYQINSRFFTGVGLDFENCNKKIDDNIISAFVDGRADFKFGKFTPFTDLRLGYSLNNGGGIYFSPSIGYRFNWGRKLGVNIAAGYTLRGIKGTDYRLTVDPDGYQTMVPDGHWHDSHSFFSFRVGIDF